MQALFYVFPREILLKLLHVEITAGLELRARAEDADNAFVQRPADLRAAGIGDDCWISVCPESDGGLPTPRTPSEIRGTARGVLEGRDHIMAADGRDNTACFMKGARIAADLCRENGVRLALLKAKSPSCGFGQVYDGTFTGTLVAGRGLTAELLSDADVRVLTENDLDLLASLKTQEDPAC